MGMYQRIELMSANGLLDMPTTGLIYIYKLTSKFTGHYYIGQTNSVKDRMYSHLTLIVKTIEGQDCKPLSFHIFVAEAIKAEHLKDRRLKIERFTREALSVYVMALVADKETANLVESHYIKKYKSDPLCLNTK